MEYTGDGLSWFVPGMYSSIAVPIWQAYCFYLPTELGTSSDVTFFMSWPQHLSSAQDFSHSHSLVT